MVTTPKTTEHPSHIGEAWNDLPLFIDGQQKAGDGPSLIVVNPATEGVCATIRGADAGQTESAIRAARQAFDDGPWRRFSRADRSEAMFRLADCYERVFDRMVESVVTEVGTPVTLARTLQVGAPLTHLRYYAETAKRDWTEPLGPHFDPVPSDSLVAYRPVGVVGAISAYNFPLVLAMHKVGAALAAGCTIVLVPSPHTPITTLLFAEAVAEADLPPGVLNVLVGGTETARTLTEHPLVDKVAFTGSTQVGSIVMQQAGAGLRDVVLELGGKSPAIIMPDADIEAVTPELHVRYCRNGGQGCAAPTCLLVPDDKWDTFLDISKSMYDQIKVGDPWDADTVIGPMITDAHRERVEGFVGEAVDQGATVAAGGGRPAMPAGWYTNPTLVIGADNGSRICQEEIFGPVAVAHPYRNLDEAIELANDSRYGLHAYLFTKDLGRAIDLADRLRAGSVTINGGGGLRPDAPMGGFGVSGVGREIGKWGIHEYLEPQHIQWPLPR